MTMTRDALIKPGLFSLGVPADSRRGEFDFGNESLLMQGVRPDFLFAGDSITHFWEVQAYFGGTGKLLVNRGIGADTSTYLRKRFAADVLQLRPHVLVMKIGTNDLDWCREALDEAKSDLVCDNISAMVTDARAAGITVALCSLLPIWGPSWYPVPEFTARKNAQIVTVNQALRAQAQAHDAIYVDYHSALVSAAGDMPRDFADDGVHPHHRGYAIMAQVLRDTLRQRDIDL
ncbi:MAG TPA: GDSL-type esterase/lipase family protein [Armatimonadota bacterium]|jgi:lysophospholipase L1-like esterase